MERLVAYRPKDQMVVKTLGNGVYATVTGLENVREGRGPVAIHEGVHAVLSRRIKYATIVPHGDALGTTLPEQLTPAAAAGPAAVLGEQGTSWDRRVTEEGLGVSWSAAKEGARHEINGKWQEVLLVAGALETEGTIYQRHVDTAFDQAARIKAGRTKVRVEVESAHGGHEVFDTETQDGQVVIEYDLHEGQEVSLQNKGSLRLAA